MTIESDWDDWLLCDVADASPDGLTLWYLGCNGFILKSSGGTTVFIDPYLGTGDPPRTVRMIPIPFQPSAVREADAVFGTHEHTDHVHGPSQGPILAQTGADYYTTDSGLDVVTDEAWTETWDVTADQIHEVTEGDVFDVGDLTVHVEPANDPDAEHPVSFIIEHGGATFFHGGDARPGGFETVGERYDIDLGVLAFGTVGMIDDTRTGESRRTKWYNDENQIIQAANELQLDTLVPTHWDMWKGMTTEPTVLHNHSRSFPYPHDLELLEIGDRTGL